MTELMEPSTTPYIIIGSKDVQSLVDTVNSQILRGYQPIGGLSVCPNPNEGGILFNQAMLFNPSLMDDDDE